MVTIIESLVDWHRFRSFKQSGNKIADLLGAKRKQKPKTLILTAEEKQQATKIILRCSQQENFGDEKQTHLEKLNRLLMQKGR